jgi:hypothetical protein
MTTSNPAYHFALIVEDIGSAMEELTTVLRLSWTKVMRRTVSVETADGAAAIDVAYAYSLEGPPHFELIERREGTVFGELGLHHIGVWSDDYKTDSARLEELGWPRETVALKPDGSWAGGLYHRGTGNLRLEVVDIANSGPKLLRFLSGGDYA